MTLSGQEQTIIAPAVAWDGARFVAAERVGTSPATAMFWMLGVLLIGLSRRR